MSQNPPHLPDPRTYAAERLIDNERVALAMAAGPLALLVTQLGLLVEAETWIKALATVTFASLIYCCAWQVRIINYAGYWLASERLGRGAEDMPGRTILNLVTGKRMFGEEKLAKMIRSSTLHYSTSYWIGGVCGGLTVLGLIWG